MGKPTGFMEFPRKPVPYRDAAERLRDFGEIYTPPDDEALKRQAARCMDCGVPFCQADEGCPIDNLIPEWNDLVYQAAGATRWTGCTAPTISRSLPAAPARRRARARACWELPIPQ